MMQDIFTGLAQTLVGIFASGGTVTLGRKSDPTVELLTGVPAVFPGLSAFERISLESGAQAIEFAEADLKYPDGTRFRLDGSSFVQLEGSPEQYPFTPDGGPAAAPSVSEVGDTRALVRGFIQMGA